MSLSPYCHLLCFLYQLTSKTHKRASARDHGSGWICRYALNEPSAIDITGTGARYFLNFNVDELRRSGNPASQATSVESDPPLAYGASIKKFSAPFFRSGEHRAL
jgi:hypothetical protein